MDAVTNNTVLEYALEPYFDFDPTTNRVVSHVQQYLFAKIGATITNKQYVHIYLNERLYDLFVGLPYDIFTSRT